MPWRLIALSCALLAPSTVAASVLGAWTTVPTTIWSLTVPVGTAFMARRRGYALRPSVLATVLVVAVDVLVGVPLGYLTDPEWRDFALAPLVTVAVLVTAVLGAALGLLGVFAARVFSARRPA